MDTTNPLNPAVGSSSTGTSQRDSSAAEAATCAECGVGAVFNDRDTAEVAVDALRQAGFSGDHVGFALRGTDVSFGGMITDAEGTKDGRGAAAGMVTGGIIGGILAAAVAAIPGFGPVLAGGILASFFGGAIAGTAV